MSYKQFEESNKMRIKREVFCKKFKKVLKLLKEAPIRYITGNKEKQNEKK